MKVFDPGVSGIAQAGRRQKDGYFMKSQLNRRDFLVNATVSLSAAPIGGVLLSEAQAQSQPNAGGGPGREMSGPPPRDPSKLSAHVFCVPEKSQTGERARPFGPLPAFDPMTSTLIFGANDAVLIDALTTVPEAEALADWIALHNRNLTTIYITHSHFDHWMGLSVILKKFPGAKAIATPKTVALMRASGIASVSRRWPGQITTQAAYPEPYDKDAFTLEGNEIRIIQQGHTDSADTTSVYVPSIDLVVAGDVVYNKCHMFVAQTTTESRREWVAALDRLAALNPKTVVAGHKDPSAPDSPDCIAASKQYLIDFGRLRESTATDKEIYDKMTELYPDWVSHQSWLMFR